MKKSLIVLASAAVIVVSCTKSSDPDPAPDQPDSGLLNRTVTRQQNSTDSIETIFDYDGHRRVTSILSYINGISTEGSAERKTGERYLRNNSGEVTRVIQYIKRDGGPYDSLIKDISYESGLPKYSVTREYYPTSTPLYDSTTYQWTDSSLVTKGYQASGYMGSLTSFDFTADSLLTIIKSYEPSTGDSIAVTRYEYSTTINPLFFSWHYGNSKNKLLPTLTTTQYYKIGTYKDIRRSEIDVDSNGLVIRTREYWGISSTPNRTVEYYYN